MDQINSSRSLVPYNFTITHINMLKNWIEGCLRRQWQPTPVLLPGKSHGRRSVVGYCPWGCKESGTTELLTLAEVYLQGRISYHHQNFWHLAQGKQRALDCELKRRLVLAWTPEYSLPGLLTSLGLRIQDKYSVTQCWMTACGES